MSNEHAGPLPGSYWVLPGRLLAGPYPGSPDPDRTRERLSRLCEAGVTAFVDLTQDGESEPYVPLLPEGVQYRRFAVRDFGVPSHSAMLEILDAVDAALDAGQTVYLHCWGGIGRTGTAVGCFLVRHGQTGAQALQEIARLRDRSGSPETDEQRWLVTNWHDIEEGCNHD